MKLLILSLSIYSFIYFDIHAQSASLFLSENSKWENIPIYNDGDQLGAEYFKVDTLIQTWQQVFSDEASLRRLNHRHLKIKSAQRNVDLILITSEYYNPQKKWMVIHADLYRKINKEFWLESWRFWMMF